MLRTGPSPPAKGADDLVRTLARIRSVDRQQGRVRSGGPTPSGCRTALRADPGLRRLDAAAPHDRALAHAAEPDGLRPHLDPGGGRRHVAEEHVRGESPAERDDGGRAYVTLEHKITHAMDSLPRGVDVCWVHYTKSQSLISFSVVCCLNHHHPGLPCPLPPA